MTNQGENTRRRPVGVWVISAFYALATPCMWLSFVLVLSGAIPADAARQTFSGPLGVLGLFMTVAMGVAGLSAAVCLFLLRRAAVALFAVAFGLNLGYTVFLALATNWLETVGGTNPVSMVLADLTMVAILLYTRGLAKRGVLS